MGKLRLSVLAILLALGIGFGNAFAANGALILDRERERVRSKPLSLPKSSCQEEKGEKGIAEDAVSGDRNPIVQSGKTRDTGGSACTRRSQGFVHE